MPTEPKAGEVWFADLGMAEKSRPVLLLAFPHSADARSLAVVAPLTSQIRGLRGEVDIEQTPLAAKAFGRKCARAGQFRPAQAQPPDGSACTTRNGQSEGCVARFAQFVKMQIEADLGSGRLDDILTEVRSDVAAGKTRPLDHVLNNR